MAQLGLHPAASAQTSPATSSGPSAQIASVGTSGGFLGMDRYDVKEDHGIYSRRTQKTVDALALVGLFGAALWEGTDSEIGRTSWRAVDAVLTTAITTEALKSVTGRPRPANNPDPNVWGQGRGNRSFPSGETAMMAALVTPFIVDYAPQNPWVWGLVAAPVYMGAARMKSQGHWLTDVLAGAAIGATEGYFAAHREVPFVLRLSHDGVFVGFHQRF